MRIRALEELVEVANATFALKGNSHITIQNPQRFEIRTTEKPIEEIPPNVKGFVWDNKPAHASHYSTKDSNGMKKIIYYNIPARLLPRNYAVY